MDKKTANVQFQMTSITENFPQFSKYTYNLTLFITERPIYYKGVHIYSKVTNKNKFSTVLKLKKIFC